MKIKGLKMTFYKDVLFEIECDSNKKLEEALKLKYGEPEFKLEKKQVSCIYKYTGNKVNYEDKTFMQTWENGNIKAVNYTIFWHNDKCEDMFLKSLIISDFSKKDIVDKCEKDIRNQHESKEKQKRVNKLKDF